MSGTKRQRTLHYKHAVLFQGGAVNLQALVTKAVASLADVEKREQEVVAGGVTRRVMSGVGLTNGMLTAKVMQYTRGQKQQFFEKDPATGDYRLDAISPPQGANLAARREFVESLLYLAIFEDHVAYIGGAALGSKHLEDYLNWLLRTTGHIVDADHLLLQDQPSAKALEDIGKHPIDKVVIGGDLQFDEVQSVPAKRKTKSADRVEGHRLLKPIGGSASALEALLGDWFGDAPLKAPLRRDERIEYKLELAYRNRNKTSEGFDLMQKLAVAGRHFDIHDTQVHLHKGGTLRGPDLKLEVPLDVAVTDGGLIVEPDVWQRIYTWLQNALGTKKIGGM